MVKAKRRKSKSPKTIDLKADAVFEQSEASKATDAALEAGLNTNVDVVVDDLGNSDAITAEADIVVDGAIIEAAENEAAENTHAAGEADKSKSAENANGNGAGADEPVIEQPIIAPVKQKSRLGLYAGTFLSALVGGGIALGGAGALNKIGWLKYVPYADGLVYGGETSKDAVALEAAQAEIDALKVQITELGSGNINPAKLIERIAALEAGIGDVAGFDLSSIENAIKSASEKSDLANQNAQNALVKIEDLSTKIVTTAGGIDSDVLKDILAGQSSDLTKELTQAFENRISALETLPEITPVDNSKFLSQIDAVSSSVTSLSTRIDGVEIASQESSSKLNETLNLELGQINAKIDNEILAPMVEVQAAASAAMTGQKVAYSVTARSLKAALEHGGKFSSEVFAVQALLGENETLDLLIPIAEKGVQTPKQLLVGFEEVEDRIFEFESKPTNDANILDKFLSSAKSLIKIRPKGTLEGVSAIAVASRVRSAIGNGALDRAKTEWEGLPDAAKDISAKWYEGLSTRIEAGNLVSKLIEALSATTENKG